MVAPVVLKVDLFLRRFLFFIIIAAIARTTVVLRRRSCHFDAYLIIYKTIISRKRSDLFTAKQRQALYVPSRQRVSWLDVSSIILSWKCNNHEAARREGGQRKFRKG